MTGPSAPLSRSLAVLALLLLLALPVGAGQLSGRVTWVYDGDTIRVSDIGKVRLLGIDSPEREASPKDAFYLKQGIARSRLRLIAARATDFTLRQAKDRTVLLELPAQGPRDDYGRLLALVYLPDGRLLNLLLVENGLAAVYRRSDFRLRDSFLAAEKEARHQGAGLWAR